MHDGAGQCAVSAGTHLNKHVRLFCRAVQIGIDHNDFGVAVAPGFQCVGHHIDLCAGCVSAPDNDQIGSGHLARVDTGKSARTCHESMPGQRGTDRRVKSGIAFDMAQSVDPVAHHESHGPGIVIGPHALATQRPLRAQHRLCNDIEGVLPVDRLEAGAAL